MKHSATCLALLFVIAAQTFGQEATPAPTAKKRGWFGRILHPFSSTSLPRYQDAKLNGLALDLLVAPQTVKLSEVRQLEIKLTLTNQSKRPITLDFPTDQRIEIYLKNSADAILTKWSDNHAITGSPGMVLINPQEHVEYNETIATRDLPQTKFLSPRFSFPNIQNCASA